MKVKFEDKLLTSDDRQFIVKQRRIAQEGKKAGEEVWDTIGYYRSLGGAIIALGRSVLLENNDLRKISKKMDELIKLANELKGIKVEYKGDSKNDEDI